MIIVMGYLEVSPSYVDAFTTDMQSLASSTRAEKGCLFYALTLDDARTGRILIAERWEDQKSLSAHLERRETVTFLAKWGNRIKGDVLKFDAANERSLMD